jgi:desulfoferrodoxin-like iron-binding protein
MPSHKSELYHCEICGAEVVVKKGGDGTLNCCRQKMKRGAD